MGHLKQAISQGTFPMINVGYDTEISDVFHGCKVTLYDSKFPIHPEIIAVRLSLFTTHHSRLTTHDSPQDGHASLQCTLKRST
jgi:hypothetical protein